MARYGSPALDLHYNIFGSSDREIREQHYASLLESYYSSLSATVEKLGSDPKKLLSRDDFDNQLKKYGNFAILMSPMIVQMLLTDPKDIVDLDEFSETLANDPTKTTDFIKGFNDDTQQRYDKRVSETISDIIDLGYYSK